MRNISARSENLRCDMLGSFPEKIGPGRAGIRWIGDVLCIPILFPAKSWLTKGLRVVVPLDAILNAPEAAMSNGNGDPIRFGVFEVDLAAGELRKQGLKIKLR